MRKIDSIIVHCSATKAGQDFTAADIDRWHRERGFNGIGYHYVIRLDGRLEKGREIDYWGSFFRGCFRDVGLRRKLSVGAVRCRWIQVLPGILPMWLRMMLIRKGRCWNGWRSLPNKYW